MSDFRFLAVTQQATSQGFAPHPGWLDPPTNQQAKDRVQECEIPFCSHFGGYPNKVTNILPKKHLRIDC